MNEYENGMTENDDGQMEFDTRLDSERDLQENVAAATEFACKQLTSMQLPRVTSRHDGYGIASQYYSALKNQMKAVDQDMKVFLSILASDDSKGIEAASALKNSASEVTMAAVNLTAQANRIANDLYMAVGEVKTPIEEYMDEHTASEEDFEKAPEEPEADANEQE